MDKKIAIVTGASKGIGQTIAHQLVTDGYHVIGTYVQDYQAEALNAMTQGRFELVRLDVSDYEACQKFASGVLSKYGRIDALINNAGITKDRLLMMMTPKDFDDVIAINLKGTFTMCQVFAKQFMKQRHGSIVNITSVIGLVGNSGQANYAASKAGVIGFTKSMAKEMATRNVRVNCVAPGFIETSMTQTLDEKVRQTIENQIALKRFGTGQDVADAVSFLISDKASYITGQVLSVCGGMVI